MTLFRIISFLTGYVTVVIRGAAPERLINMASSRGIWLWNIKWISQDRIMASIRLSGLRPLRHIARETGCRFSIGGRHGFPFFISRIRRRKTMAVGAVLFLALLYMLSSFIWFVEVTGNTTVTDADVLKVARQAGLFPGVLKWNLDTFKVEKAIQDRLPKVFWAGVHIKGTRAVVEIAEKTLPPEGEDDNPTHIVAVKAGLIKEILVLKGHPVVEEGQTVKKGQILISGEIPPPEVNEETGKQEGTGKERPRDEHPRYVHARGIVHARVWYEGYGEVELVETGVRRTGNEISRVCMKIGDREIILAGPKKIPFNKFDKDVVTKRLPAWRNINLPVEINTERYFELESFKEKRSYNEARKKAVEMAIFEAKSKLPGNAKIIGRKVEEIKVGHRENMVRMKVLIETLEEIGVEEPFKP